MKSEEECSNLLYFANKGEFKNMLNKVNNMSDDELIVWEEANGFKSYGMEAERLYKTIHPESFKSVEEVKSFVNENSHYLQLTELENGEYELDTKFDMTTEKYLMNTNQMYQIGDSIYKYFTEGMVVASSSELNVLLNEDVDFFREQGRLIYFESVNKSANEFLTDCGISATWRSTNGKERLKVDIGVDKSDNEVTCSFLVRPYHKVLGIWYWCTRTVKADIEIYYRYNARVIKNGNYSFETKFSSISFSSNYTNVPKYEGSETLTTNLLASNPNNTCLLTKFNVSADSYDVSPISEDCNW